MKHHLLKRGRRSVGLLFTACFCGVLLIHAGVYSRAQENSAISKSWVEIDREVQAIKTEILEINREILLLEEASLYPRGEQLIVFVTIAKGVQISPEQITLRLNGNKVSQHDYSGSEEAALHQGGAHRLYAGRLNEGEHQLAVSVSGKSARDKNFLRQRSIIITKNRGLKYIELQLDSGKDPSTPSLAIHEWQQ